RAHISPRRAGAIHLQGLVNREQGRDQRGPRRAVRGPEHQGPRDQHRDHAQQEATQLSPHRLRKRRADDRLEKGHRQARRGPEDRRPVRERVGMPVRKFKPTSPGRRFMSVSGFDEITTDTPEKTLLESLPTHAGRNNQGRITTRHQGGGYRKIYRKIDFRRDKVGVAGKVATIEYDPNRSARIALIHYKDGEKRYILAPLGLKVGDPIESGPDAPVRIGNAIPLEHIPVGSTVHNIELTLGPGGHPKTPWGKPALGYRTRKQNKASSKLIIRRREKKGRKK